MKDFFIKKSMNYIKKNTNYNEIKLKEIKYGLEGLYLTFSKFIIISSIAILLNQFKEMLIFLLTFNLIRFFAFGLHATKTWICLITSIIIFIGIPYICNFIIIKNIFKFIICISSVFLIFKNAPADTHKKPIVSKRIRKAYKLLSTTIAIILSFICICTKNNFLSNCLIFSLILENILISPITYKIFKLPYNNYIKFLKDHPDFNYN